MVIRNLPRKHHELLSRFKEIQARFENAKTIQQRRRALKDMHQLNEETRSLLGPQYVQVKGA